MLLPLREKVSAQLTDEGSLRPISHSYKDLLEAPVDPSSDPAPQGHLLPQGEKERPGRNSN